MQGHLNEILGRLFANDGLCVARVSGTRSRSASASYINEGLTRSSRPWRTFKNRKQFSHILDHQTSASRSSSSRPAGAQSHPERFGIFAGTKKCMKLWGVVVDVWICDFVSSGVNPRHSPLSSHPTHSSHPSRPTQLTTFFGSGKNAETPCEKFGTLFTNDVAGGGWMVFSRSKAS